MISIKLNSSIEELTTITVPANYSTFFGNDKERMAKKLDKAFFPKDNSERKMPITDLALLRLMYLASYGKDKSPFTQKELVILHKSDQQNCLAIWGLRTGLLASSITLFALSYVGFVQQKEIGFKIGLATAVGLLNVAAVAVSFWATGFAPHYASNAFNDKQDALLKMQSTYVDLAHKLIEIFYSEHRNLAIEIAQSINIGEIKREIADITYQPTRAEMIVERLDEALCYITSEEKQLPSNAQFKRYILDCKEAV